MPSIVLEFEVIAPVERVFDLSRSVEVHIESSSSSGEQVVAGRTEGLMELGDEVTWRARHLGVWQELTSRITAFDFPNHFRDSMVRGAFKSFEHNHRFIKTDRGTLVEECFEFQSPGGWLGRLANTLVVTRHMRRFLQERNQRIKQIAESDQWCRYLERQPGE